MHDRFSKSLESDNIIHLNKGTNCCFFNTAVQQIFNIPEIREDLKNFSCSFIEHVRRVFSEYRVDIYKSYGLPYTEEEVFSVIRHFYAIERINRLDTPEKNENRNILSSSTLESIHEEKMSIYRILNKKHKYFSNGKYSMYESSPIYRDLYSIFCLFYDYSPSSYNGKKVSGTDVIVPAVSVSVEYVFEEKDINLTGLCTSPITLVSLYKPHFHIEYFDSVNHRRSSFPVPSSVYPCIEIEDAIKYIRILTGEKDAIIPLTCDSEGKWSVITDYRDTFKIYSQIIFYRIPENYIENPFYLVSVNTGYLEDGSISIPMIFNSLLIESLSMTNYVFRETGSSVPPTDRVLNSLLEIKKIHPVIIESTDKSDSYYRDLVIDRKNNCLVNNTEKVDINCGVVMSTTEEEKGRIKWRVSLFYPRQYYQIDIAHPIGGGAQSSQQSRKNQSISPTVYVNYDMASGYNGLGRFVGYSVNHNNVHFYSVIRSNGINSNSIYKCDDSQRIKRIESISGNSMVEYGIVNMDAERVLNSMGFCRNILEAVVNG